MWRNLPCSERVSFHQRKSLMTGFGVKRLCVMLRMLELYGCVLYLSKSFVNDAMKLEREDRRLRPRTGKGRV